MPFKPPGQCPVCGEWVPRGAAACDECGACEKSGWKDEANLHDGLDLPDDPDEFDYDRFIEEEFGGKGRSMPKDNLWRWVAAILLAVLILGYILSR